MASSPYRPTLFAFYLFANVAGALLVFSLCHNIAELARQEERGYYDSVDGVTFFCSTVPIFLIFGFVNVLWMIKALIDAFKRRDFRALTAMGIVFTVWAADLLATRLDTRLPT